MAEIDLYPAGFASPINGNFVALREFRESTFLNCEQFLDLNLLRKVVDVSRSSMRSLEFTLKNAMNRDTLDTICGGFENLCELTLNTCEDPNLSAENMLQICKLTKLKSLILYLRNWDIPSSVFNDKIFEIIVRACPNMKIFFISSEVEHALLTIESIRVISVWWTKLESITFSCNDQLDDNCCQYLKKLKHLQFLDLSSSEIGDEIVGVLQTCKDLKLLWVEETRNITDETMKRIAQLARAEPRREINILTDMMVNSTLQETKPPNFKMVQVGTHWSIEKVEMVVRENFPGLTAHWETGLPNVPVL